VFAFVICHVFLCDWVFLCVLVLCYVMPCLLFKFRVVVFGKKQGQMQHQQTIDTPSRNKSSAKDQKNNQKAFGVVFVLYVLLLFLVFVMECALFLSSWFAR